MDLITFSLGCRTCRETDGKRWSYEYSDEEGQLPLKGRTDFGVMRVVELMNKHLQITCPFCSSSGLEVFDMEVNGHMLFDYSQICQRYTSHGMTVFSLRADKVAGQLEVHILAEPTEVTNGFLMMALDYMVALVEERPAHDFAAEVDGNVYICVAGHWDPKEQKKSVYPQKYTCHGLTREEVQFVIQSVKGSINS